MLITGDSYDFTPSPNVSRSPIVSWNIFLIINSSVAQRNITPFVDVGAIICKWCPKLFPSDCLCWKRKKRYEENG
jgi:hypothetical protein